MTARLLLALVLSFFGLAASAASDNTSLLADRVEIVADKTIVASGNVEILYQDYRLRAPLLIYDSEAETLTIEGPITLQQGDRITVLADSAELDRAMANGIMRSARLVLDQQLQIAATEIHRVDGRYSQLYQAVASSCQVCADNPVPLWQIRAQRVIHDQETRQLYFHNAQFRVLDVPIMYLPRLRMPDPSVDRYTGFLVPEIVDSGRIGTGMKIPYFIALGDHADITLTPFVTTDARTMEARYRQAFSFGSVEFNSAISNDNLEDGLRGYIFGDGRFQLPLDYVLRFNIQQTSDSSYLLDYDYSGKDRLENRIELSRARRETYSEAGITTFETLRGSELLVEDQLPNIQGNILYIRRFQPASIGGQGNWQLSLDTHKRQSDIDVIGLDLGRLGAQADWSRSAVFANGMLGKIGGRISGDFYHVKQDSSYDPYLSHVAPAIEAELRWPFLRTGPDGGSQVLEPVVYLVWSDLYGDAVPNEDSTLVEFDEGNLYAMSRFPGRDRYETGLRATTGLTWTHYAPSGWSWAVTAGHVYRATDPDQFSNASGLAGQSSDWLLGTQVKLDDRLSVDARMLLDEGFDFAKSEARIAWNTARLDLFSSYSRIIADPEENRPDINSQIQFNGSYDISRNWVADFDLRYDVTAQEATRAALGVVYRNECVNVDLSLSRRFTSSSNVVPTTSVGLSIGLNGFGADGRRYRRSCSG